MKRILCVIVYICQIWLNKPLICAMCSKDIGYHLLEGSELCVLPNSLL
jgi:hypothetical protein